MMRSFICVVLVIIPMVSIAAPLSDDAAIDRAGDLWSEYFFGEKSKEEKQKDLCTKGAWIYRRVLHIEDEGKRPFVLIFEEECGRPV